MLGIEMRAKQTRSRDPAHTNRGLRMGSNSTLDLNCSLGDMASTEACRTEISGWLVTASSVGRRELITPLQVVDLVDHSLYNFEYTN